jgi:hypothetical protein
MLGFEMQYRREFRAEHLAWKFPHACFRTLDGGRWFGVATRPPKSNVIVLLDHKRKRVATDNGNLTLANRF